MAKRASGYDLDYWKRNTRLITILLAIWAFVSYGCGILFANALSGIHVFVALIFIYAWKMDKMDREYDVHEEDQ